VKTEWTWGLGGREDSEGVRTERKRRVSGREDREGVERPNCAKDYLGGRVKYRQRWSRLGLVVHK
jgi:hypothetical protein